MSNRNGNIAIQTTTRRNEKSNAQQAPRNPLSPLSPLGPGWSWSIFAFSENKNPPNNADDPKVGGTSKVAGPKAFQLDHDENEVHEEEEYEKDKKIVDEKEEDATESLLSVEEVLAGGGETNVFDPFAELVVVVSENDATVPKGEETGGSKVIFFEDSIEVHDTNAGANSMNSMNSEEVDEDSDENLDEKIDETSENSTDASGSGEVEALAGEDATDNGEVEGSADENALDSDEVEGSADEDALDSGEVEGSADEDALDSGEALASVEEQNNNDHKDHNDKDEDEDEDNHELLTPTNSEAQPPNGFTPPPSNDLFLLGQDWGHDTGKNNDNNHHKDNNEGEGLILTPTKPDNDKGEDLLVTPITTNHTVEHKGGGLLLPPMTPNDNDEDEDLLEAPLTTNHEGEGLLLSPRKPNDNDKGEDLLETPLTTNHEGEGVLLSPMKPEDNKGHEGEGDLLTMDLLLTTPDAQPPSRSTQPLYDDLFLLAQDWGHDTENEWDDVFHTSTAEDQILEVFSNDSPNSGDMPEGVIRTLDVKVLCHIDGSARMVVDSSENETPFDIETHFDIALAKGKRFGGARHVEFYRIDFVHEDKMHHLCFCDPKQGHKLHKLLNALTKI